MFDVDCKLTVSIPQYGMVKEFKEGDAERSQFSKDCWIRNIWNGLENLAFDWGYELFHEAQAAKDSGKPTQVIQIRVTAEAMDGLIYEIEQECEAAA